MEDKVVLKSVSFTLDIKHIKWLKDMGRCCKRSTSNMLNQILTEFREIKETKNEKVN